MNLRQSANLRRAGGAALGSRLLWFVTIYGASIVCVTVVAFVLKALLRP